MAQKIATICFRITSVYLFYYAVSPIVEGISVIQDQLKVVIGAALVGSALLLVLGVCVWWYAPVLPEKLLWPDAQESGKQPIAPLLFRIIGLYLFFTEIPTVVWAVSSFVSISVAMGPSLSVGRNVYLPVFLAITGVLTWRFAGGLATRFVAGAEGGKSSPSISWDDSDL